MIKNWKLFKESIDGEETFTLYHGTSKESEEILLKWGWYPERFPRGSQMGNPKYLYVSQNPEGAEWYAAEKGNPESVLVISGVPKSYLGIDPEEYLKTDLDYEIENNNNLTIRKPIGPEFFQRYDGEFSIVRGDDFDYY